jgi:hypothetical protein
VEVGDLGWKSIQIHNFYKGKTPAQSDNNNKNTTGTNKSSKSMQISPKNDKQQ